MNNTLNRTRKMGNSRVISHYSYLPRRRILLISFRHDTRVYAYYDVPYARYYRLGMTSSPGRYFARNIAPRYKYKRL